MLKVLDVEGAVEHVEGGWRRTLLFSTPFDRVAFEPAPAHGLGEGGPQHGVEPQDRGRLPAGRLRQER